MLLKKIIVLAFFMTSLIPLTAHAQWDNECVIPPSGPWPSCATGGGSATPTPPPGNGNGNEECVIPPSGPWPSCATGGGGATHTPPPGNGNEECVIPPSGPWPSCAIGTTMPIPPSPPCVIPHNGPVPDCVEQHYGSSWGSPDAVVNEFRIEPAYPQPGDTVRLIWNVTGVSDVTIHIGDIYGHGTNNRSEVWLESMPPVGSLFYEMPPVTCRTTMPFEVFMPQDQFVSISFRVPYPTRPWLFDADALGFPSCPVREATFGRMAEQRFERGWMIWSEASDEIMVLMDEETSARGYDFWTVDDTFDPAVDPVSDPNIVPPDGLRQPEYGFGKVWREFDHIREQLGWAVSAEKGYSGHHQGWSNNGRTNAHSQRAVSGADGFVWVLEWYQGPSNWEKTAVRNP